MEILPYVEYFVRLFSLRCSTVVGLYFWGVLIFREKISYALNRASSLAIPTICKKKSWPTWMYDRNDHWRTVPLYDGRVSKMHELLEGETDLSCCCCCCCCSRCRALSAACKEKIISTSTKDKKNTEKKQRQQQYLSNNTTTSTT